MARPQIALVTSRQDFEEHWRAALAGAGLECLPCSPEAAGAVVRASGAVVLDAATPELADEDELLAWAGSAAARGRPCAIVAASDTEKRRLTQSVLFDVARGLVVGPDDVSVVTATLRRRTDVTAARRFDYVTVAPDGDEILAITAAGHSQLLARPAKETDSGAAVVAIQFDEDARRAQVVLDDDATFAIDIEDATIRASSGDGAGTASGMDQTLPIDGVSLGKRMRQLRVAAGLTQAELARRTGIHRPNIARVEAGRHTPSLETVARIAQAIGVSPTKVLSGP